MGSVGYEYLLAYKITVPIYDYTVEFCRRHWTTLSSTRTHDQMVQAARSGMTNIPEGYTQKSLASYIKLAGVARASLEELLKDYLSYARHHQIQIWESERAKRDIGEIRDIWAILRKNSTLPSSPNFPSLPNNPEVAINLMITLIKQASYIQDQLIRSLEAKHQKEGGFSENLLKKRLEYRNRQS